MADAAFNDQLLRFLRTLSKAFPDSETIPHALAVTQHMANSDDPETRRLPRLKFTEETRPHLTALRARDTEYLSKHMDEIEMIRDLGIRKYWVHEDMPEKTRKIIWDQLGLLVTLSSALDAVDPNLLPVFEQIAEEAVRDGSITPGQPPDMATIMQKVMSAMGGLGGLDGPSE